MMAFKIHFSQSEDWYYIDEIANGRSCWYSVEKFKELPKYNKVFEGAIEVKTKSGEKYYRKLKPFIFWKIKSGKIEDIDPFNDLVLDYDRT